MRSRWSAPVTRRSSENARAVLPKIRASCGAGRELAVDGEAAALGDERHQWLDQVLVIDDELLAFLDAGDSPVSGDPVHGARLRVGLVAEHVEDARGRGDRAPGQRLFDPLAKLFLREELLEGALPPS